MCSRECWDGLRGRNSKIFLVFWFGFWVQLFICVTDWFRGSCCTRCWDDQLFFDTFLDSLVHLLKFLFSVFDFSAYPGAWSWTMAVFWPLIFFFRLRNQMDPLLTSNHDQVYSVCRFVDSVWTGPVLPNGSSSKTCLTIFFTSLKILHTWTSYFSLISLCCPLLSLSPLSLLVFVNALCCIDAVCCWWINLTLLLLSRQGQLPGFPLFLSLSRRGTQLWDSFETSWFTHNERLKKKKKKKEKKKKKKSTLCALVQRCCQTGTFQCFMTNTRKFEVVTVYSIDCPEEFQTNSLW